MAQVSQACPRCGKQSFGACPCGAIPRPPPSWTPAPDATLLNARAPDRAEEPQPVVIHSAFLTGLHFGCGFWLGFVLIAPVLAWTVGALFAAGVLQALFGPR